MEPIQVHFHNGTDSNTLDASDALNRCPQAAVTAVTGTAGATYTAAEQQMINDLKTAVNDIISKNKKIGLTL